MDGQQGSSAPPQYSPDGKWWWDGSKWVAVHQPPAAEGVQPRPTSDIPAKPRLPHQTRKFWIGLGVVVLAFTGMGVCLATVPKQPSPAGSVAVATPTEQSTKAPTPTPTSTPRPTSAATPRPSPTATPVAKLTADQKAKVQTILQGAIDHYAMAFTDGEAALGTTQYPDAFTGLAAFNDPNSAASRFSAWRGNSKVEQDVKTYLDAFTQADAFYNADNEPQAIGTWRDDMGDLQGAISQWVEVAVSWQIKEKSDADLQAAASAVNAKLNLVRSDLAAVVAAS